MPSDMEEENNLLMITYQMHDIHSINIQIW